MAFITANIVPSAPRMGTGHLQSSSRRTASNYYDCDLKSFVVPVVLGHHRLSDQDDDVLVTTLGSCVAACIHDPVARVGGMNHFLLPGARPSTAANNNLAPRKTSARSTPRTDPAARYGSVAMELLINDLLANGARRERLEVKVFGGARVIETSLDIGASNATFVLDYLKREGLTLTGHELGGLSGRRIHFYPTTGRVMRRLLRPDVQRETIREELDFLSVLRKTPIEGEVELFTDR